jgi:hypothetical protein
MTKAGRLLARLEEQYSTLAGAEREAIEREKEEKSQKMAAPLGRMPKRGNDENTRRENSQ